MCSFAMKFALNFSYLELSYLTSLLPSSLQTVREGPFISHNCDQTGQRLLILNDYLIEPISRAFREIGERTFVGRESPLGSFNVSGLWLNLLKRAQDSWVRSQFHWRPTLEISWRAEISFYWVNNYEFPWLLKIDSKNSYEIVKRNSLL